MADDKTLRCAHCGLPNYAHAEARVRECLEALSVRGPSPRAPSGSPAEVPPPNREALLDALVFAAFDDDDDCVQAANATTNGMAFDMDAYRSTLRAKLAKILDGSAAVCRSAQPHD